MKGSRITNKIERREKFNSFAFVSVFFLYSLASFPGMFIGTGIAIIILTVLLFLPLVFLNGSFFKDKGTIKALLFEVGVLVLLLFESIYYPEYGEEILKTMLYVSTIGIVGIASSTLHFNIEQCYKYGTILALLGGLSALTLIVIPKEDELFGLSMRFGYALLPSVLWFLLIFLKNRSKWALCLFVITFFPMLIWGSRGTIAVVLMFLFLYSILLKRWIILLLLPVLISFIFIDVQSLLWDGIVWLQDLTGSKKLGSYSKIIFDEEEARDSIYNYCLYKLNSNFSGYGVGWWEYDPRMGGLYPHNLILHVGTEFGLLGLLFLLILLVKSIMSILSVEINCALLFVYFFSISIGRLLVSSSYWERPEFWFVIGLFLFTRNTIRFKKKHISR